MAEILVALQDKNLIQWPQPLRFNPMTRDSDQYYQFHRTNDYDISNYYQMRNKIEKLIKRGHLKNFVKKDAISKNRLKDNREPIRERAARP